MNRYSTLVGLLISSILAVMATAGPESDADTDVTVAMFDKIVQAGPRSIGLPGHQRTAQLIEEYLGNLKAGQLTIHEMQQVVPVVESAHITIDERQYPVFPFWPNGVQLPTTTPDGISADVVYLGDGHERHFRGKALDGAIVALEYNSSGRWKRIVELGARAFLFLAPEQTSWIHSHAKYTGIALPIPRFYVNDEALVRTIRQLKLPQPARLVCRASWSARPVRNLIWELPGQNPQLSQEIVVLHARYDASCVVPQLAWGAEQAIGPAALCALAQNLAQRPHQRKLVLIWTGADTMNFASWRAILGTAQGKDKAVKAAVTAQEAIVKKLTAQRAPILESPQIALQTESVRKRYQMLIKQKHVPIQRQLKALRRANRSEHEHEIDRLKAREDRLLEIHGALRRKRIEPKHRPLLEAFTPEVVHQIDLELAEATQKASDLDRDRRQVRPLFNRKRVVAVLAVDLTSQGPAFGIYWRTEWQATDHFAVLSRLGRRLIGHRGSAIPKQIAQGFVSDTLDGRRHWRSDIVCPLATAADVAQHFGYLSLAFITAHDGRWLIDSPLDKADRINRANVRRQMPPLFALVNRAADLETLKLPSRLAVMVSSISGQAVVSGRDNRANLGQPGRLVMARKRVWTPVVGTRELSVQHTNATGQYAFPYLSKSKAYLAVDFPFYVVDVVHLDKHGRIVEIANQKKSVVEDKFVKAITLGSAVTAKSMMFECTSQSIAGLRDPRYLHDLYTTRPLLARTGDEPHYFSLRTFDGLASLHLEADRRWMMAISRGKRSNRMLLLGANEQYPLGQGFPSGHDQPVRSALRLASEDFYHLNQHRLDKLNRHGITGALTEKLQKDTRHHLDDAEKSYERNDTVEALGNWRAALGLQQMVYSHILKTADDVVLAVVFLLAVLLPFSHYAERLLINASTIYGRIGWFVVIFAVMMGLLYTFHPAFRITISPLAVLLAFVIIVLSMVVIIIVYARFNEQLRSDQGDEHTTSLSRLNVISQSMLVGVANMRRRKIRTCFTLATLIVMTFALLSLSGTQTELTEKRVAVGTRPTYPGIMITQMGWWDLPFSFLDELEAAYGDRATIGGQYWRIPKGDFGGPAGESSTFKPYVVVHKSESDTPTQILLTALMGIGPNEHEFLPADEEIRSLFLRLANHPDGCLLPASAAHQLGVEMGDSVRMMGRVFSIEGIFTEATVRKIKYLNDQSYGPIDLFGETELRGPSWIVSDEPALDQSTIQAARMLNPIEPSNYAFITDHAARQMGSSLHSICLRVNDPDVLDDIARDLATHRAVPVYRSRGDEVELIGARTQFGFIGLKDLVIPLIIGSLIVMNTMFNAVADQRSTIHIYTSLGLAPVHVGVLFLSEAAALGTLGVVGGFVVGQGFAVAVKALNLMDAITLNYSSTAVILTMAMVMSIVLLSAIYPAGMASRLAVPAESSRWQLPAPVGEKLSMELPFTVSELTAKGATAFLHEWLTLHSESGMGVFISNETSLHYDRAKDVRSTQATVWLAPYDVGVSQQLRLEFSPVAQANEGGPRFFNVMAHMRRLSGQQTPWLRSNRAFIAELRKQLLLWRALSPSKQQSYVEQSEEMTKYSSRSAR